MTVVIVDDEVLVRTGIKASVDWDACDATLVGDFPDGESALEYLRTNPVDIVITDIVMPGMNGVELMRAVRELSPSTRFVVLTSFNEFQYAREALRLGADDYILKLDMGAGDLTRTLCEVARRVSSSVFERDRRSSSSTVSAGDTLPSPPYRLLAIRVDNHALLPREARIDSTQYVQRSIQAVVTDLFSSTVETSVTYHDPGTFEVLFSVCEESPDPSEIAERICANIRLFFNLSLSVAVGPVLNEGQVPADAAQLVDRAWQVAFYEDTACHVSTEQPADEAFPLLTEAYFSVQRSFISAVETGDLSSARKRLDEMFEHAGRHRCEVGSVREVATNIVLQLERYCAAHHERMSLCLNRRLILHTVQYADYLSTIEQTLRTALSDVLTHAGLGSGRVNRRIREVMEYVEQHLSEPIGLGEIAVHLNVSMGYLSRLFRQETGVTFHDYLRGRRMDQACVLLTSSEDLYMYEVASGCGYDTFGHFARVFKQAFGMTPIEYRKSRQDTSTHETEHD